MNASVVKSDLLLLSTAIIWGFAFVAQRLGMEYVGPFIFNGVRFALGALVLLPFILINSYRTNRETVQADPQETGTGIYGGIMAGIALFSGASLQQMGLVYTSAGNAGFITGLYVVIVPLMGIFLRHKTNIGTWTGALLAAAGLYLLSVTDRFTIAYGDLLVLTGAFFWAGHVIIIGWFSPRMDSFRLAFMQYLACAVLSMLVSLMIEDTTLDNLFSASVPIFYGGVMSVGIAYTLQVIAQKGGHPAHAAILLSLEAVFAAVGGWIILNEAFTSRELLGCSLMLSGMLISQLWGFIRIKNRPESAQ